jgi:hypothetical protein
MLVVPTFAVVRSTGEVPGFAPAVSSWLRRRPSPRPTRPDTCHRPGSSPRRPPAGCRHSTRLRTALPPRSTGFERVDDQEALRHRFLTYTVPSRSPGPTHPVVLSRPDFVAAAPTQTRRSPSPGCRQLHPLLRQRSDGGLSPPSRTTAPRGARCAHRHRGCAPQTAEQVDSRVEWLRCALHATGCQSTRRCRASAETVVSSWASASVAHVTARLVSTARGAINSCASDQVPAGQPGSAQRQTRLSQTISTGSPKQGASAAVTRRRPCPVARTPQRRQPVASASVSTVITSLR